MTDSPLAAPRDIEGNEGATFVRCPDCSAAVFNLRHQRQKHLAWHDEQATLLRTLADLLGAHGEQLGDLRGRLTDDGPVPLVADWPADELADRRALAAAPTDADAHEGEPAESAADTLDPYGDDDPFDDEPAPTPQRRF